MIIPCSAETELLLRKASKAGIVNYSSGDEGFKIIEGKEILPPQQKALDLVKSVFSKIHIYWNSENPKHCYCF